MQLYPAIDIKEGHCVRLTQGLFDCAKVYSDQPEQMALSWQKQGARYLHLVDLDGARDGRSVNETAIERIVKLTSLPVQLGGGIRTQQAIESMIRLGVTRVIIGTKAVEQPEFVKAMVAQYGPERIVVGIDAKDGLVAIHGWETVSSLPALDLCMQMKEFGVRHVVYTDISKDGMLKGPNVACTRELTEKTGMDIIASGGISSMADLEQLSRSGIQGAIIGKALYENRISLQDAVRQFESEAAGNGGM